MPTTRLIREKLRLLREEEIVKADPLGRLRNSPAVKAAILYENEAGVLLSYNKGFIISMLQSRGVTLDPAEHTDDLFWLSNNTSILCIREDDEEGYVSTWILISGKDNVKWSWEWTALRDKLPNSSGLWTFLQNYFLNEKDNIREYLLLGGDYEAVKKEVNYGEIPFCAIFNLYHKGHIPDEKMKALINDDNIIFSNFRMQLVSDWYNDELIFSMYKYGERGNAEKLFGEDDEFFNVDYWEDADDHSIKEAIDDLNEENLTELKQSCIGVEFEDEEGEEITLTEENINDYDLGELIAENDAFENIRDALERVINNMLRMSYQNEYYDAVKKDIFYQLGGEPESKDNKLYWPLSSYNIADILINGIENEDYQCKNIGEGYFEAFTTCHYQVLENEGNLLEFPEDRGYFGGWNKEILNDMFSNYYDV